MITLFTGTPGAGKTQYAVKMIRDILAEGLKGKPDKGIPRIYTNINGLKFWEASIDDDGNVQIVNKVKVKDDVPAIDIVRPLSDLPDNDWRKAAEGSLIVYDEAQKFFPSTGRAGLSDDKMIRDLDTHRHGGYNLFFITQDPTLIHSQIRKFVGKHYHLHRKHGAKFANIYEWDFCVDAPRSLIGEQEEPQKVTFTYDSSLYELYKSSEIHNHKFRLPRKALYVIGGIGVYLVGWLALTFWNGGLNVLKSEDEPIDIFEVIEEEEREEASAQVIPAPPTLELPPPVSSRYSYTKDLERAVPLSGCAATDKRCDCFDEDGYTIDMSLAQCLSIVDKPLPKRLTMTGSSTKASN